MFELCTVVSLIRSRAVCFSFPIWSWSYFQVPFRSVCLCNATVFSLSSWCHPSRAASPARRFKVGADWNDASRISRCLAGSASVRSFASRFREYRKYMHFMFGAWHPRKRSLQFMSSSIQLRIFIRSMKLSIWSFKLITLITLLYNRSFHWWVVALVSITLHASGICFSLV